MEINTTAQDTKGLTNDTNYITANSAPFLSINNDETTITSKISLSPLAELIMQ